VLARLPLGYLLLMAAFATFVVWFAFQRWIKMLRLTVAFLVISVVCCLGMIAVGAAQYQQWNARQMLVLYSFGWTGLAIGLFPSRKILSTLGDEWRRGVQKDTFVYPKRYTVAVCTSVTVMSLLAFVLST